LVRSLRYSIGLSFSQLTRYGGYEAGKPVDVFLFVCTLVFLRAVDLASS